MPSPPILVPTDFSPSSAEAYAYALQVARATQAHVHLFHVIAWPDAGPFEVPGEARTAAQEDAGELALAREALSEAAGEALDHGEVTIAARHGNVVALEIADYAEEIGAGLVVMGTRGPRAQRASLGAVPSEVLQTAPCDVLLVPPHREAPYAASAPGRILVPVDFSSASRPLVAFAFDLARDLGAPGVDLVHVLEPLPHPVRWIDETLVDVVPEIRQRAADTLRDLVRTVGASVEAEGEPLDIGLYVERGKAARALVRTAEALDTALIVVGPHAERPVFDRLLGSVAEGVTRRASCPVLVARRSALPATESGIPPPRDERTATPHSSAGVGPAPAG